MKRSYLLLAGIGSACIASQESYCSTGPTVNTVNRAVVQGTPTPSPTPVQLSITPTPTPDPCAPPVTAVHLSGPLTVANGETFKIDVTPVNATGPLEGALDYCNLKGRSVIVESLSANLRCVGQCQTFGPQFVAQGVGPFSIKIRVDAALGQFDGTVLK